MVVETKDIMLIARINVDSIHLMQVIWFVDKCLLCLCALPCRIYSWHHSSLNIIMCALLFFFLLFIHFSFQSLSHSNTCISLDTRLSSDRRFCSLLKLALFSFAFPLLALIIFVRSPRLCRFLELMSMGIFVCVKSYF